MSHDRWAHLDAAFLLHALDEEEAAAFEDHAATCEACHASVADLRGVLPYLIGSDEDLLDAGPEPAPPPTLLPRLLEEARRTRRRRSVRVAAGAAVAAGLGAAAAILAFTLLPGGAPEHSGDPGAVPARAMTPLRAVPVRATAALQPTPWGTRVTVHCRYAGGGVPTGGYAYGLTIRASDGTSLRLGTWTLMPGRDLTFTSGTALPRAEIAAVDITTAEGTPLLELRD